MKRTFLITITYAATQMVIGDGEQAVQLTAQLHWIAETAEAARIWAMGLSGCIDLIDVVSVIEVFLS